MSNELYIDDIKIPSEKIIKYPEFSEIISFDSSLMIPDSAECELDNSDNNFNPVVPGSILFGHGKYSTIRLYDSVVDSDIFKGIISNIVVTKSTVTIEMTSDLSDAADTSCIYSATGITPAQAIYEILTKPPILAEITSYSIPYPIKATAGIIEPSMINKPSFDSASQYQLSHKCTVNISAVDSGSDNNNVKVSDMIEQLCKLGHCSIYTYANVIYLYQWKENTGTINIQITSADILAGTLTWQYATDEAYNIRNQYRIAYAQVDSISFAQDKDDYSIGLYRLHRFCIPEDDVNSSGSEDYNVILDNYAGAKWCGDTGMTRFSTPTILMSFTLDYKMYALPLGSEITMQIAPYTGWNLVIIERNVNKDSGKIEVVGVKIK
jgi:hypothetical protein